MAKKATKEAKASAAAVVEHWDAERLVIPSWNPQIHDEENIRDIKRSLREFGYCDYIVVRRSDGLVVGGAGRLMALRELWAEGWKGIDPKNLPVLVVDVDDRTAKKLALALNRIQATPSIPQLASVIQSLAAEGESIESLTVTGFKPFEIADFLNYTVDILDSSLPELPIPMAPTQQGGASGEDGEVWVERRFSIPLSLASTVDDVIGLVMKRLRGKSSKKGMGLALVVLCRVAEACKDQAIWEEAVAAVQEILTASGEDDVEQGGDDT